MKEQICDLCFKDFTYICEIVPTIYCIYHNNLWRVVQEPCHRDNVLWSYTVKPMKEDPSWGMDEFDEWLKNSNPPTTFDLEHAYIIVDTFIKGGFKIDVDGILKTWCCEKIAEHLDNKHEST